MQLWSLIFLKRWFKCTLAKNVPQQEGIFKDPHNSLWNTTSVSHMVNVLGNFGIIV